MKEMGQKAALRGQKRQLYLDRRSILAIILRLPNRQLYLVVNCIWGGLNHARTPASPACESRTHTMAFRNPVW